MTLPPPQDPWQNPQRGPQDSGWYPDYPQPTAYPGPEFPPSPATGPPAVPAYQPALWPGPVGGRAPESALAVASLMLAIIGVAGGCCTFGVPSIIAVILGHVALRQIHQGRRSGHGTAIAGLVIGYAVATPAILLSIWFVFLGGLGALTGHPGTTPSP